MAAGRRKNSRRVLVPMLRDVAREVRNRIGQWRPDKGLVRAARPGEHIYPEQDLTNWDDIAALGLWLVQKGRELHDFAIEQKHLPQEAEEPDDPAVHRLSKAQYEALDSAGHHGNIHWVAGGTKHSLYKYGLVARYPAQTDQWKVSVTDKGHQAMRAYEKKHPEVLKR